MGVKSASAPIMDEIASSLRLFTHLNKKRYKHISVDNVIGQMVHE